MNRILSHPADNKMLRRPARKVKFPQSTEVVIAVQTMKKLALEWEQRNPGATCVGLAAPQIGVDLRIIIIRSHEQKAPQDPLMLSDEQSVEIYGDLNDDPYARKRYFDAVLAYEEWKEGPGYNFDPFRVMYNPVYGMSEGMQDSEEGCLSVPYAHGVTLRPQKCTFFYYDHNMKRCPPRDPSNPEEPTYFEAVDFTAAVINHEFDHLAGKLFVDHAYKLWKPGTKEEFLAKQAEEARIEGILEEDREYDKYESEEAA